MVLQWFRSRLSAFKLQFERRHLHRNFADGALLDRRVRMRRIEIFWMACDCTEPLRSEYGPFHTRSEAETEARRLGFGFLLRYEHVLGENEHVQEVRSVFLELPPDTQEPAKAGRRFYTRCATCGEAAMHDQPWLAEVWADIHEFEHSRHKVRLFEQNRADGLKEIGNWRESA
jgi:hypothetical protein